METTETEHKQLTQAEHKEFYRTLMHGYYLKDYARINSTPEKPFRFEQVMIMEADEHSWYKHLVGTTQLIYLHGVTDENGVFKPDFYYAFRNIRKGRIEITGRFKKEHLDI